MNILVLSCWLENQRSTGSEIDHGLNVNHTCVDILLVISSTLLIEPLFTKRISRDRFDERGSQLSRSTPKYHEKL